MWCATRVSLYTLYSSASILMNYFCIYRQILRNVICSQMTAHCIQQEKALCKFNKCYSISVWCNTNHMLINPMKTKWVVTSTQQKHQSLIHKADLSLRLSSDGQNIENVTEHHILGLIVDNKFQWQAQIKHICKKHVIKTPSAFSTATLT